MLFYLGGSGYLVQSSWNTSFISIMDTMTTEDWKKKHLKNWATELLLVDPALGVRCQKSLVSRSCYTDYATTIVKKSLSKLS